MQVHEPCQRWHQLKVPTARCCIRARCCTANTPHGCIFEHGRCFKAYNVLAQAPLLYIYTHTHTHTTCHTAGRIGVKLDDGTATLSVRPASRRTLVCMLPCVCVWLCPMDPHQACTRVPCAVLLALARSPPITERSCAPCGVAAFMLPHSKIPYSTVSMVFSSRKGIVAEICLALAR